MTLFRANDYRKFHNDIVFVHGSAQGRLIGIHYDILDAYYGVAHFPKEGENEASVVYYSAAGACESLRGTDPRYDELDAVYTRRGVPHRDTFTITRYQKEYQNEWCFSVD